VEGSEPSRLDRLRRAIASYERRLNRRGWTVGIDSIAELRERIEKFDKAEPARPAHDSIGPPPAGRYDDPEAAGVRRYWNGTTWTDSRVTTEGIPYELPADAASRTGSTGFLLAAVLLIAGGICLWIAENYKPTLSNQLGLNGNSLVLTRGAYHALMIVGIVCLVLGGIRLLAALVR
jgi:hypothetical protein